MCRWQVPCCQLSVLGGGAFASARPTGYNTTVLSSTAKCSVKKQPKAKKKKNIYPANKTLSMVSAAFVCGLVLDRAELTWAEDGSPRTATPSPCLGHWAAGGVGVSPSLCVCVYYFGGWGGVGCPGSARCSFAQWLGAVLLC